jgi:hypothetical protein
MSKYSIIPSADELQSMQRDLKFYPVENSAPHALSQSQIEHYNSRGFIAPLDVYSPTEIADIRAELKGDIADVRLEIAELRTEMHQMFRKNYMVMISAIFAINSLFFAATKYWG